MFADKNRAACEALAMRGARASIKLPVGVGATMEYDGRAKVETAYGYALPASYRGVPVFVKLAHKHVAVVRECFTPWFHKHYSFSADMENETNNLLRMRSMPHPNVAMMHPAFQQLMDGAGPLLCSGAMKGGTRFVVMPFYNGGDLLRRVTLGRTMSILIPMQDIRRIMADCVKGLDHLHHKAKMAHMSISLESIIVHDDGVNGWRAVLADLGNAIVAGSPRCIMRRGRGVYMAPEIFKLAPGTGLAGTDPRPCDVYALGVVLATLLTLDDFSPGYFQHTPDICGMLLKRLPRLPNACAELCAAMLAPNPRDRPTVAQLAAHPFFSTSAPLVPRAPEVPALVDDEVMDVDVVRPSAALLRAANGAQALPTAPVPTVRATVGLSPHPASPEQGGGGALMQPLSEPVSPPRAPHQACYVMGMLREWDLTFDMELDMRDIEEARQHFQAVPAYRTGYRDIDSDNDSSCDDRSCDGGSSTIGDSDSDEGIDSSSVGDSDPDDDVDMDMQVAYVFAGAPTFDLADVMALPLLPPLSARAQVPPAVPPEPAAVPGTVPRRAAAAQATPPPAVKPAAQQAKLPRSAPPAVVSAPLSPSWATTGTPAVAAAPPGPASMPTAATAGNGSGLPITPRLLACV